MPYTHFRDLESRHPSIISVTNGFGKHYTTVPAEKNFATPIRMQGDFDKYQFYLAGVLLPWTPSKYEVSNSNQNETFHMADDTYLTVAHRDGSQTITFQFKIPKFKSEFSWIWDYQMVGLEDPGDLMYGSRTQQQAYYPNEINFESWTDWLWNLKNDDNRMNPKEFMIIRNHYHGNVMAQVLVKDYKFSEDAEDGSYLTLDLTLETYRTHINQEVDVGTQNLLTASRKDRGWRSGRGVL